jgi:hypothetical protein
MIGAVDSVVTDILAWKLFGLELLLAWKSRLKSDTI